MIPKWAQGRPSIARPNINGWWKPEVDGPIDGVMRFHDAIRDARSGKPRRIFIVSNSARKGFHWGVGERTGLIRLRNVPVGSRVYIDFLGRRETGATIDGEKQTIMDFDVRAEQELPEPIPVSTPPGAQRTVPASDDDIPF